MSEESSERSLYRSKCKHYGAEEICYKKSGYSGCFHITYGCDGKCRRMRNYDKKQEIKQ